MKRINKYPRLLCMAIAAVCIMFANACGDDPKDEPVKVPVLTTAEASAITTGSATAGGNITSDGGGEVTARGVCWGTSAGPTIEGSKTTDGKGTGSFTSNLTGLTAGTKYYVRAYAVNSAGTAYGNEVNFTTDALEPGTVAPVLTTAEVSAFTATTAIAGGDITNAGTPAYTERGVCYAATANPTTAATKVAVDGSETGAFTANLTGLTAGTKYYVRAYAVYSGGTVYGNEVNFTTSNSDPSVLVLTTSEASAISATTAITGGIIPNSGMPAYTERGVCFSLETEPTIHDQKVTVAGTGAGAFTANLTKLIPDTKYYVRAYVFNESEVVYGNEISFTTLTENIDANSVLLLDAIYFYSENATNNPELYRKFEYDSQGRIAKILDGKYYQNFTYDASGGLTIQQFWYDEEFSTQIFTKKGNIISVKVGNEEGDFFILNDQGLPAAIPVISAASFTYDSKGNTLTVANFFDDRTFSFTYDNKKGPFSSCNTPKWYLFSNFIEMEVLGGYVNNILTASSGGESSTYEYEYNVAGYPTRYSWREDSYYTCIYRKK